MTTFFISRHPGAVVWAHRKGFQIDRMLPHLDTDVVKMGDIVIGTLPLPLLAHVCARGARYLHLNINLPMELRGQELTADQLTSLGASLVEYRVLPVEPGTNFSTVF